MNEEVKVKNRLEAIVALAQELQGRATGTAQEQHAFWLMVDTMKLHDCESELFETAIKISGELEENGEAA